MPRLTAWFSTEEVAEIKERSEIEYFSVAQDAKMMTKPPRVQMRTLILDYSKYVKSRKSRLNPEDISNLYKLFVSKVNLIINQFTDDIAKGVSVINKIGVTDPEIKKSMVVFQKEYRKLLRAKESLGYIPKMNQSKVDKAYTTLIDGFKKLVFTPVINDDENEQV